MEVGRESGCERGERAPECLGGGDVGEIQAGVERWGISDRETENGGWTSKWEYIDRTSELESGFSVCGKICGNSEVCKRNEVVKR